jgi:hypothetical protein
VRGDPDGAQRPALRQDELRVEHLGRGGAPSLCPLFRHLRGNLPKARALLPILWHKYFWQPARCARRSGARPLRHQLSREWKPAAAVRSRAARVACGCAGNSTFCNNRCSPTLQNAGRAVSLAASRPD